jgi:hypothetical protein
LIERFGLIRARTFARTGRPSPERVDVIGELSEMKSQTEGTMLDERGWEVSRGQKSNGRPSYGQIHQNTRTLITGRAQVLRKDNIFRFHEFIST